MKRIHLFITMLLLATFANSVSAQSDNATLKIRLYPIQTITINPAQKGVDLDYKTVNDYKNGVSSTQANHLTVYSTGAFTIKVKSGTATLQGTRSSIDASDVNIAALAGTNQLVNAVYESRNLNNADQILITSAVGSVNKNFNIIYKAAGGDKFVDKYFKTENPTVYTTTVTYTIESN